MSLFSLPTISLRHPVRTGTRLAGTAVTLVRSAPKVAAALPEITVAAARWAGASARGELARRFGHGTSETPELESGATLAHDELPLPDYDHLTLGSLRARIARLSPAELLQLREYEQAHANRLAVVLLFDNRLAKVTGATTEQR